MNDYTANAGYAAWHARNWRAIPDGTQMGALPALNGGLEVIWKINDPALGRDTDVSFVRDADETLNCGTIWDENALVRIFTLATNAA